MARATARDVLLVEAEEEAEAEAVADAVEGAVVREVVSAPV